MAVVNIVVSTMQLIEGDFGPFEQRDLELRPGSMVVLNARAFHGVSAKPEDSVQEYRFLLERPRHDGCGCIGRVFARFLACCRSLVNEVDTS